MPGLFSEERRSDFHTHPLAAPSTRVPQTRLPTLDRSWIGSKSVANPSQVIEFTLGEAARGVDQNSIPADKLASIQHHPSRPCQQRARSPELHHKGESCLPRVNGRPAGDALRAYGARVQLRPQEYG